MATTPDILYSQQMQLDICNYFGLTPSEVEQILITRDGIEVTFRKPETPPQPGKPYLLTYVYPLVA